MKLSCIVIICLIMVFPILCQEEVKETVSVEWWVLPLFSVDKKGNPVIDLKKEDIQLWVNNKKITEFSFYRQAFTVSEEKIQPVQEKERPIIEKKKTIFFLFDTALTNKDAISRSKSIACEIVRNTGKENKFIIMTINPSKGLRYCGGPLSNKNHILKIINEKVRTSRNSGSFSIPETINELNLHGRKYSEEEINTFLLPHKYSSFKQKAKIFFASFETLYYSINLITDNKFVYLFTGGISEDAQVVEQHGENEYRFHLSRIAKFLGRSGAVLFIIDGAGSDDSRFAVGSGKESLRFLAQESGGKHFKGTKENIVKNIENTHRAYYEIAFPDLTEFKGQIRRITLKSKRRGINIHTLKTLEKSKTYADMNETEREVLIMNLIYGNPLASSILPYHNIKTEKTTKKDDKISYQVIIPDDFLHKRVELFKIRISGNPPEPTIEKESTVFKNNTTEITFDKMEENTTACFVIVYKDMNFALVKGRTSATL